MNRVRGSSVAAIALLAVVLMPACASLRLPSRAVDVRAQIAEYREEEVELVRTTIADPARAERLLALLVERDRLADEYAKRITEHRQKMAALAADYDAERGEFEALLARFNQRRAAAQRESLDVVAAMKETTTANEWKTIARFQLKRLNLRQLSYGQAAKGD
jgi:septal ring factor EnvC (AmiA/AmiB activator)